MEYYQLDKEDVLAKLKSNIHGLTLREVKARQQKYGKNIIEIEQKLSFFRLLARQFKSYLMWLLILVAIIAFIAGFSLDKVEQTIDGIIISFIVLINAFVGAYQDYKSERSAQLLKSMLKNEALAIRENKKVKIDARELVPGDIIILEEGDKVPADCRILEAEELSVDESILTGESMPVSKNSNAIKKDVPLAERRDMVFMNTFVVRGNAKCVVTAIGKDTEVGKIAKSLEIEEESLFLKEVDQASKKITYVALALIFAALSIYYLKAHSWLSIFMLGSALIIGSIPEGLPAIVTFSLSMSSLKLARKNVLVKRKTLLETLGSVDVICTDKTGTLTQNKMTIKKIYADDKVVDTTAELNAKTADALKKCALLCNEAKDTQKGFVGEAEDIALIDFFNREKVSIVELREKYPYIKFEPFSSERKFARSYNKIDGRTIQYIKGAPEVILKQCKRIIINGRILPLRRKHKEKIQKVLEEFSKEALRNIALAFDDVFIAITGIYDPPKKGIKKVISNIYKANIELKMITGDNAKTAEAIAKECGFRNVKAISWDEMRNLSEGDLTECVQKYNVFARVSPIDKLKIVAALQNLGKRVAITGDGVNDVPALKEADVGVAMGKRGTDIAKEAADLIILDDDLESIVTGIKEGRTIFSNIRKVINYLLTANLAEVLVVFISSLYSLMPFSAIQLLWVNFVTDVAPAMALGIDPPHKNIMRKRPTGKNEKLINKRIVWLTVGIGVKKVVLLLVVFLLGLKLTHNLVIAQTMTFTWLVFSHFVRVVAIRFDEKVNLFVNKYLNWSVFIPVVLQLIIIYTPLAKFFKVKPLPVFEWIILIVALVIAVGLAKWITYVIDKHLPLTERDY